MLTYAGAQDVAEQGASVRASIVDRNAHRSQAREAGDEGDNDEDDQGGSLELLRGKCTSRQVY
jgi:hypothetical protein